MVLKWKSLVWFFGFEVWFWFVFFFFFKEIVLKYSFFLKQIVIVYLIVCFFFFFFKLVLKGFLGLLKVLWQVFVWVW